MAIKTNTGFTLLEILISVGVLAVVSTLITQVLFTTTRVNKKVNKLEDVKSSGEFALGVMERLIRNAVRMETTCDLGEEATPAAVFRNPDNGVTTLVCTSDGTVARIASISAEGTISYLTDGSVTLSDEGGPDCEDSTLLFSCPVGVGVASTTTINFDLRQIGGSDDPSENARTSFQSSVTIRN